MLFNSAIFPIFLLSSLILYYALPPERRKTALLAFSYTFYGLWNLPYLLLLVTATAVAYVSGIAIQRARSGRDKRKALLYSLGLLLGSLALFKYAGVLGELARLSGFAGGLADSFDRILVPLGISYYTFKLVSYVVDIYWDKIPAENDFTAFGLYVAFFSQILSGPIQRPGEFLPQVRCPIATDPKRIVRGLRLMLFGYFKKFVVADSLAVLVNEVYAAPLNYNSACVLLACYAFVIQLYADFSGFTDIAIGIGRLYGIESPRNFDMPFYSPNLQVLWRRWHMTLTRWLADYVFMPLRMGLRAWGAWGLAAAITINFIAIGIWHGATLPFLAFGLLHAFYMCVSVFTLPQRNTFFDRWPLLAGWRRLWAPLITFQLWTISEVLFRADSLGNAGHILRAIVEFDFAKPWVLGFFEGTQAARVLLFIILMEVGHWMQAKGRLMGLFFSKPVVFRWTVYFAVTLMTLYKYTQGYQEFIYFRF